MKNTAVTNRPTESDEREMTIMRKNLLTRSVAAACGVAMLTALAACGDNVDSSAEGTTDDTTGTSLSGEFAGAGASSQQAAVEAWIAGFETKYPDVTVSYNPTGSGAGVTTFLTGATVWAGSDAALSDEEVEESADVCANGTTAFDIPVYISPIAVVFNLEGISGEGETLNMDADTIAKIFDGQITMWNDPAIQEANPDVDLPDLAITVVHRSESSGTTENFVSYLKDAAPDSWPYEVGEDWPNSVGQGAQGTSGLISTVQQANGTIGYADFSQAGSLGTVAVQVGDEYVPISSEAAAAVIDDSPRDETAEGDNRVVIDINHNTEVEGAYPIVLVSYAIACPAYEDADTATFTKEWLTYIVSEEGQETSESAAGNAPMSDTLRETVMESINAIETE